MGVHGSADVRFDFDGALRLARQLWSLADDTDTVRTKRTTGAQTALSTWLGDLVPAMIARCEGEQGVLLSCSAELRNGAYAWAAAWKEAMDENNRRRRARKVTEVRDNRSWGESLVDTLFTGDDSDEQVPAARTVATPSAPNFYPTDTPQVF